MPGPKSEPREHYTNRDGSPASRPTGKTALDKKSGKWARRLLNRHSDPIRENGGKQFGKTK